ncbi:uncharacterized protein LOC126213540 [Schistocerca nitens]|uniref:uncharacterized protein LOC126213540 n=1 Tax=Schistocerca nitens TaxID=7011 RepID=UPI0021198650|nr:uncharacterized protein LOC126213540 [Schistocerca nitens]
MESPTLACNPPDDVLFCVFAYLPIPELVRCATVCKQWYKIVTGFTHLWKGKSYVSSRSPRESAETCAVLSILPLLQEIEIKVAKMFEVKIYYPQLFLSVTNMSDIRAVQDCQRLGSIHVTTDLSIADIVFSSRSPICFTALRTLKIVRGNPTLTLFKPGTRAECAIIAALELCPFLTELSLDVESLSANYLNTLEGLGRLEVLRIHCRSLNDLTFLRHCSDKLEELELESCDDLPSAAYAELRHLGKLQMLRLCDCRVGGADMEVAAAGLRSLEKLQLDRCGMLSDLSFLRFCSQLEELRVEAEDVVLTGLKHLPARLRSLCLVNNALTGDELSEVVPFLRLLEELNLCNTELVQLGFLRYCRRLRRLCLKNSTWPDTSELSGPCNLTRLETLVREGAGTMWTYSPERCRHCRDWTLCRWPTYRMPPGGPSASGRNVALCCFTEFTGWRWMPVGNLNT